MLTPSRTIAVFLVVLSSPWLAAGFLIPSTKRQVVIRPGGLFGQRSLERLPQHLKTTQPLFPILGHHYTPNDKNRLILPRRHMSYNLPPGKNRELKDIAIGILSLVGVIAFFLSPLGALVFALFNSLILLSFAIPVGLWVAFQIWQFVNTTEGPCPSCGAPVRVLKDTTPSLCLNCGTFVQHSKAERSDGRIEIAEVQNVMDEDEYGISPLDGWFRTPGITTTTTRRTTFTKATKTDGDKFRRERTIIDVDVEED